LAEIIEYQFKEKWKYFAACWITFCERADLTVIAQVTVFIGRVIEDFQLEEKNTFERHVGL
jgi:hypothetical protein